MKKILLILGIIVFFPLCFVGCFQTSEEKLTTYTLDATFDEEQNILSCEMKVDFVNNTDSALDKLCFFLYPNSFAENQKTVPNSYKNLAYPNGESFGNIQINSAYLGENSVEFFLLEPNFNILTINLQNTLFPKESTQIGLDFDIKLANINHRLGYGENTINFGNFIPLVCVYEEGDGFYLTEFSSSGDPFYSDVANFDVTIKYDKDFKIATTGECSVCQKDDQNIAKCTALKVRDFCFVLSKKFEIVENVCDGVTVKYFYYDDQNAEHFLKTATDALSLFSNLFKKYPYKTLSIVKTNFCFGGMEYPNLVTISDNITDEKVFDYVIVHEVAHQWWYSLVGNNEFEEAWVDESLTDYCAMLFFKMKGEYDVDYDVLIENARQNYTNFVSIFTKINGSVDQSMNRSLSAFDTDPEYTNCVYVKGVLMYDSLRCTIGEKKFLNCLKNYCKTYAYKNASGAKLVESFSKTSHINLTSFFDSWLGGTVIIN